MRIVGAVLLSLAVALPTLVAAQAPAPKAKAVTKAAPKAAPKAAKAAPAKKGAVPPAYAAMSVADRIAIQSELIWVGVYKGIANGEFGAPTLAAIKEFQKDNGGKETGVLTPQERTALTASAKEKQETAGWKVLDDAATGARLGLPLKMAPQASRTKDGTRWTSPRGEVVIETFRIRDPSTSFAALYERMRKEPEGRKSEYNVIRADFFVISGLQGLKKFYVRAHVKDGDVRGVTILYDQAVEGVMEAITVAMSSAFTAFPTGELPGPRLVEYGTGIVVDANGYVVTDRQVTDGCYAVTLAGLGRADLVAEDKGAGLALLRVYGARDLAPIAAGDANAASVTLLGIADPQVQPAGTPTRMTPRLGPAGGATRTLEPAAALGFAGAAALDAQGRLAGMAQLTGPVLTGTAATTAAVQLVPLDAIKKFLAAQSIPLAATAPANAKPPVVRVICVRK